MSEDILETAKYVLEKRDLFGSQSCDEHTDHCTAYHTHCLIEGLVAEIARLREERRWVPVGEKLPGDNVGVLAWGPFNNGAEMVWREQGKWLLSFVGTYIPDSTYTHWIPLPPGPECEQ